jgi:hypothetical protein
MQEVVDEDEVILFNKSCKEIKERRGMTCIDGIKCIVLTRLRVESFPTIIQMDGFAR